MELEKIILKLQKNLWIVLLVLLMTVHGLINLFWIFENKGPIPWDSANHSYHTIKIAERIENFDFLAALKTSNYYPIFIYLVSTIPTIIFGPNILLLQFLGTVYFLITLVLIFYYLKLLTKSDKTAFFATLFFSLSAVVYNQSRLLMLDIPSVGLLFLSLILLMKSNHLENRKPTIYFFVSCALLILTKWTAAFYLLVPAAFEFLYFLKQQQKMKVVKNCLIGGFVFFAVSLPWYVANWEDIAYLGRVYAAGDKIANPQNPLSLDYILNYYKIYLYTQVTPLPALFFFFSFIPFLFLKKIPYRIFVVLMILANYFFFTLITNKDGRFTMHLLVFTSLITTVVLFELEKKIKYLGWFLISLLSGFMIFYFLLMTIRPVNWEGYKFTVSAPIFGSLEIINVDDSLVKKVEKSDWNFNQVIPDLIKLTEPGKELRLTIVSEWYHFNPSNIRTHLKLKGIDVHVITPDLPYLIKEYNSDHFPTQQDLVDFVSDKEYILAVEDNIGSPYLLNMKALKQLQAYLEKDLPFCRKFTTVIAEENTLCVVEEQEVLSSGSDIFVDDQLVKQVEGYATVYCPWGCSFGVVRPISIDNEPVIRLIKSYILPNGVKANLFKIN